MFIQLYIISTIIFFLIDLVWLSVIAKDLYQREIGFLMKDKPNLIPAVIFYLLFTIGLVFFVIVPGIEKNSLIDTLLRGAFFGLLTYSTYDLTNLSTVKNWPLKVTIIDIVWGTFISTVVSVITFVIAKELGLF